VELIENEVIFYLVVTPEGLHFRRFRITPPWYWAATCCLWSI